MLRLLKSFRNAGRGILVCIKERNFRIHLVAILTVLLFSFWYGLPKENYLFLILIFTIVPALEAVNTAIEHAVDLSTEDIHPKAGFAKDAAAGAVLIGAVGSVVLAVLLFSDGEAWSRILHQAATPAVISGIILYIIVCAAFVFVPDYLQNRKRLKK